MRSVRRLCCHSQVCQPRAAAWYSISGLLRCCLVAACVATAHAAEPDKSSLPDFSEVQKLDYSKVQAPGSNAKTTEEMTAYKQIIPGTDVAFEMVPIPGGEFVMGSPASEAGRGDDEGPQYKAQIAPFWMGKFEVTWNEYDIWNFDLDIQRRRITKTSTTDRDQLSDAVTRPTPPYTDMTFDMGHDGFPAISMTQLAAKMYCKWLSAKTGHYYRLPTEAEWEYACRAGTTTAYSFGDNPDDIDDYAWSWNNSQDPEGYHKVGLKKPNPWGLYDIHGNVAEWCLDQYVADIYTQRAGQPQPVVNPLVAPKSEYPRVVRGGSWYDEPEFLRSAARMPSSSDWKIQDPQIPKSVWYHTDAIFVGMRLVRPLEVPSKEARDAMQLDPIVPSHARIQKRLN